MTYDTLIVGAGVIGCATARALAAARPGWKILVLEKEPDVARHTSGRNSGVIHSGFNAKPGTMKSKFCVEGNRRLREFCTSRGVAMMEVGTVVVAVDDGDEAVLQEILRRGTEAGVPGLELIGRARLAEIEPFAQGYAALTSPTGSIVHSTGVVKAYAAAARDAGVNFAFYKRVDGIDVSGEGFRVRADRESYDCARFVNCAGLQADRIAHMLGVAEDFTIVAFRGDYYKLSDAKSHHVRSMIYPAPNLTYPFLGIHFTRKITGDVLAGPNAVIAFGRESYRALDVHLRDTIGMIADTRFWKMISAKAFRTLAWGQLKTTLFRREFLRQAGKLLRGVEAGDFTCAQSGNRAQLVNRSGELVEDLLIDFHGRSTHVLNAVSPGLTCSLPFADYVVSEILKRE